MGEINGNLTVCLRWNADDADGADERRFKKGASPVTPSVVEGSHIRLNSALHEMSRQTRHDRYPKINLRKSASSAFPETNRRCETSVKDVSFTRLRL